MIHGACRYYGEHYGCSLSSRIVVPSNFSRLLNARVIVELSKAEPRSDRAFGGSVVRILEKGEKGSVFNIY